MRALYGARPNHKKRHINMILTKLGERGEERSKLFRMAMRRPEKIEESREVQMMLRFK
jgi:hypothetical protein